MFRLHADLVTGFARNIQRTKVVARYRRSFLSSSHRPQALDGALKAGAAGGGAAIGILLGVGAAEIPSIKAVGLEMGAAAGVGAWLVMKRAPKPWIGEVILLGTACSIGAFFYASRVNDAFDRQVLDQEADDAAAESMESVQGIPSSKLLYLVPIALAPVAHNLVTVASKQKSFEQTKIYLILAGAVTMGAIIQRLYLMEEVGLGLHEPPRKQATNRS